MTATRRRAAMVLVARFCAPLPYGAETVRDTAGLVLRVRFRRGRMR